MNPHPLATFLSYSHKNQKLRTKLREHFVQLEREGLIRFWDDREEKVGQEFNAIISEELELTEVFILMVSAHFIASSYCSGIEMKRALERHEEGTALVFPVIVAPCDWQHSPLAKLVVAPTDGKPISVWRSPDAGWTDAAALAWKAIASFRERRFGRGPFPASGTPPPSAPPTSRVVEPRPIQQLLPDSAGGRGQNGAAAAPATTPLRVEKTELVPLYVTLPGFEMPKVGPGADQEETARVEFEHPPPLTAVGPSETTESMDLPLPLVETAVQPPESSPPPSLVEPVTWPFEVAPPSVEMAFIPQKTEGRSWRAVGMAVLSAVVLMAAAAAFVCSSRSGSASVGNSHRAPG